MIRELSRELVPRTRASTSATRFRSANGISPRRAIRAVSNTKRTAARTASTASSRRSSAGAIRRATNVCVIGDLTAIYDSTRHGSCRSSRRHRFRIVIINNGGGRIFSRVPSLRKLDAAMRERIIENAHDIRFDHWAAMWGIEDRVTELRPDAEASRRAWARYDELW